MRAAPHHLTIVAAVALAAVLLSGPAQAARATFVRNPRIPAPAGDSAVVVLTREAYARVRVMPQKNLFLDGMPLGLLEQRTVIILPVAPGAHHLAASSDCAPLAFYATPGETRLFRLREVLDPLTDVVTTSWIEDDPAQTAALVAKSHLRETRLAAAGRRYLESRQHLVTAPAPGELERLAADVTADSVVFDQILFESPLDPVNVRKQFETRPGTLTLARAGLVWRTGEFVFQLPWEQVSRMQFSGNRFFEDRP